MLQFILRSHFFVFYHYNILKIEVIEIDGATQTFLNVQVFSLFHS